MSHSKNSDGKIIFHHEGKSYVCEIAQHRECGGFACGCGCHVQEVEFFLKCHDNNNQKTEQVKP